MIHISKIGRECSTTHLFHLTSLECVIFQIVYMYLKYTPEYRFIFIEVYTNPGQYMSYMYHSHICITYSEYNVLQVLRVLRLHYMGHGSDGVRYQVYQVQ